MSDRVIAKASAVTRLPKRVLRRWLRGLSHRERGEAHALLARVVDGNAALLCVVDRHDKNDLVAVRRREVYQHEHSDGTTSYRIRNAQVKMPRRVRVPLTIDGSRVLARMDPTLRVLGAA